MRILGFDSFNFTSWAFSLVTNDFVAMEMAFARTRDKEKTMFLASSVFPRVLATRLVLPVSNAHVCHDVLSGRYWSGNLFIISFLGNYFWKFRWPRVFVLLGLGCASTRFAMGGELQSQSSDSHKISQPNSRFLS